MSQSRHFLKFIWNFCLAITFQLNLLSLKWYTKVWNLKEKMRMASFTCFIKTFWEPTQSDPGKRNFLFNLDERISWKCKEKFLLTVQMGNVCWHGKFYMTKIHIFKFDENLIFSYFHLLSFNLKSLSIQINWGSVVE